MNDFTDLESQLKKLHPRRPSPGLTQRVQRALSESASTPTAGVVERRRRRIRLDWLALGAGLAAAALLLIFVQLKSERSQIPSEKIASAPSPSAAATPDWPSSFVPEGFTRVVYDTRDEGVHFPNGSQQPVRRVRSRARETLHWRNPNTGASLRVSYPAEEVSLIPVSGQ
jgi:hypothetical protein